MKILITGGCGFLGSNLAAYGINENHEIVVFDNLSRHGAIDNLLWLKSLGKFSFVHGDVRNRNDVENLIKQGFDVIFHVAGQVAMTTSISNPQLDFEVNCLGTFHVLDAVRKYCNKAMVVYSSTNKVYGDLEQYHYSENNTRYLCDEFKYGFNESIPLSFSSPYGCSKGAADQYMHDFKKIFGINTLVFRHSSMYGGRQYATTDQGWIGWFCEQAIKTKHNKNNKFTICGNGKQVRDVLHVDDMIKLYYTSIDNIDRMAGNIYNIGGGFDNSLSLLELFQLFEKTLGIKLQYEMLPFRSSDQKVFIADCKKVTEHCGWLPKVGYREGISKMIEWVSRNVL